MRKGESSRLLAAERLNHSLLTRFATGHCRLGTSTRRNHSSDLYDLYIQFTSVRFHPLPPAPSSHLTNRGFDLHLLNQLPLSSTTERTLLHGIGCAGGVSLLRLARAQAIAAIHTPGANPPRILIVACEVTSTLVRAELELLDQLEGEKTKDEAKPNVAVTLFADAASAMIVGAGDLKDNGE